MLGEPSPCEALPSLFEEPLPDLIRTHWPTIKGLLALRVPFVLVVLMLLFLGKSFAFLLLNSVGFFGIYVVMLPLVLLVAVFPDAIVLLREF